MRLDGAFYVCLFPSVPLQSYGKAKALMVVPLLCDWIGLIKNIYMRSVYLSTTSKTLDLWCLSRKATKIDTLRENAKIIFILLAWRCQIRF